MFVCDLDHCGDARFHPANRLEMNLAFKLTRLSAASCGKNFLGVVDGGVTPGTKRNQVLLTIIAGMTAKFLVVNFKIRHGAARLAFPAVAAEYLVAELLVQREIKPDGRTFWSDPVHDAFAVKWSRNIFRCSPGRNLKNRRIDCRRTCELPFSRLAPAKKSAQIISRQ
jgi:hypothetical protein